MTDLSAEFKALAEYRPTHKVRFVTAAALFDGHDAAINIMRRILQGMGAEVVHLGHNRSVDEVVTAALQEDAQGIAISSYQGGHVEYFKYMVDLLRQRGGERIQVFGGGGGVIVPAEIADLQGYGVSRIYSPEDGQRMGLAGMIGEMLMRCDRDPSADVPCELGAIQGHGEAAWRALARLITVLESGRADPQLKQALHADAKGRRIPVPVMPSTGTRRCFASACSACLSSGSARPLSSAVISRASARQASSPCPWSAPSSGGASADGSWSQRISISPIIPARPIRWPSSGL